MQKQQSVQHNNPSPPIRLHELLTKYITEFSHLLHSSIKLLAIIEDNHPLMHQQILASYQDKISQSIFNLREHQGYRDIFDEQALHSVNTFRRFACRLVENLVHFKNVVVASVVYGLVAELIGKLENVIFQLQQLNNVEIFVEQVYQCFIAFYNAVKKKYTKDQRKSNTKKIDIDKLSDQKNSVSTTRDVRCKSFQSEPEYQRKMRKLLSNVNTRFKTLDCMDIDYSHLRSTFFQAKDTNGQFLQDYMERNYTIDAQIKDYDKDYQEYLKRKDKRRTQRSLRITMLNQKLSLNKKTIPEKEATNYVDRRVSLKTNNWASEKQKSIKLDQKKFSLIEQANSFTISQLKEKESNKIKYDIKNVVLTASRLKMEPFGTAQKMNIRNTLRQLEVSRRKYYRLQQKSFIKNLRNLTEKHQSQKK